MPDFEWQTEETREWPEVAPAAPEPTPPAEKRWLTTLVLLLLVAGAGWFVYRQAQQRVAAASARVEVDVLSVHRLVRQAAWQRDVELLQTVLSGRDLRWVEAQKALVEDGRLFDRAAFGLQTPPAETNFPIARSDDITVTLSADLTAAEITWLEPFTIHTGEQVTETVTLLQNAVYRQGERSWLLSPPERDFWGEWQQLRGAYVTLVYPERDEPVARRLVHDLDAVIVRVCTQLEGVHCPAGLSLRLRLETDARSLVAVHDAETIITSGRSLDLPTPTLVGLPVDESGYQALVRGYGAHVAAALITDLAGYECCQNELFYRALLDIQLSQLGLRTSVPEPADYERLLANLHALNADALWSQSLSGLPPADEWVALYSLAEFLLTEVTPGTPVAELQRTLGSPVRFSFWLTRFTGVIPDPQVFDRAWLHFIYERSASARADLPLPLPEQELQLVCTGQDEGIWLYSYSWESGEWYQKFGREHGRTPAFGRIYPLPGEDRYVLQEQFIATDHMAMRLSVWEDGREIFALERTSDTASTSYGPYVGGIDPSGRYLVLAMPGDPLEPPRHLLLDLESCHNGTCRTESLSGWLRWSPDGTHTLLEALAPATVTSASAPPGFQNSLYRGDARGQSAVPLGTGFWPFWLGNDAYGYIRPAEGRKIELVVAVAGEDVPHVILQTTDLISLAGQTREPGLINIERVAVNPVDPRQVLVMARMVSEQGGGTATFFLLELAADFRSVSEINEVLQTERPVWGDFSPNGRWLAISTWNTNGRDGVFHLIDLESGERQSFSGSSNWVAWSADGQWLVQPEEGYLLLRAPAHDYKRPILFDSANCYFAHWGNGD